MGIGDWVSGIFDSKNKERATAPTVDKSNYYYGGNEQGAAEAANRYRMQGETGQMRLGEQVNYGGANYWEQMGGAARQQQANVAGLMMARATGQVPSIAQQQADRQSGQLAAQQASAAASAQGPAALARAQRYAAANTAAGQSAISNQAQINAGNERLQAEQSAMGAFGAMRGQDMGAQQQQAQQSQFQAGLNQQQHAQNDAYQLGMTQAEMGVNNAQLAAGQNYEQQRAANSLGASGINAGVGGQNAAMNQQNSMAAVGLVQKVAGDIATVSDARTKIGYRADGGPVAPGQPYVVGERGPEVIVPQQAGMVVPNEAFATMSPSDVAMSTWGSGPPADDAQRFAAQDAATKAATVRAVQASMGPGGVNENPWERDVRRTSALSRSNPELVTKEDRATARRSRAILAGAKGEQDNAPAAEEKAAVASGTKVPEQKPTVGGMLKDSGSEMMQHASRVDTAYHPGQGYVPPNLIPIASDARAKVMLGAAAPTFAGAGGMLGGNPMGELQAHSDFATQFQGNPAGDVVSDERAKDAGPDVMPLYEPPGKELHQSAEGHAFLSESPREANRPSLSGESKPSLAKAKAKSATSPGKSRAMTPDEMLRWADAEQARMRSEHDARMAAGPSVSPGDLVSDIGAKSSMMMSDAAAKREAFVDGVNHANAFHEGVNMPVPSYAQGEPKKDKSEPQGGDKSGRILANNGLLHLAGSAWNPAQIPVAVSSLANAYRHLSNSGEAAPAQPSAPTLPPPDQMPVQERARLMGIAGAVPSDERAKDVFSQEASVAEANRSQAGSPYAYKPGFTPPEQRPGELNYGPMAQNMARSPIARTAVKENEDGLLMLDGNKLDKVQSTGIASLQRQIDALKTATLHSRRKK